MGAAHFASNPRPLVGAWHPRSSTAAPAWQDRPDRPRHLRPPSPPAAPPPAEHRPRRRRPVSGRAARHTRPRRRSPRTRASPLARLTAGPPHNRRPRRTQCATVLFAWPIWRWSRCSPSPTRSIVCLVPIRPLLLVAALAGGDYLLWIWSSNGASTTIALISGLALAPLILALIWLASVTVTQLMLVRSSRRTGRALAKGSQVAKLRQQGDGDTGRLASARQSSEKIAA